MIKAIMFGLVACLLSLGGTTFVLVRKATAAFEVAAAAAKDSAAAKAKADSAGAKADSASAKDSLAHNDSTRTAPESKPGLAAKPNTPAAKPVASKPAVDPAAKAAAVKQVARVLSAMKAAEAAKVLAFLSDEEVEGILRAVGPRQAADFMTNLPKERAANLSRRLMAVKS